MIALTMVVVYLFFTFGLGYFLKWRKGKDSTIRKFFIADGGLGLLALSTLLFGDLIAASTTTGSAGTGYSTGVTALWGIWGSALGCIIFALFFCKFFFKTRTTGAMTGPEAFGLRFGQPVRYLVLIFTLIPLLIVFSAQITAGGIYVTNMLDIDSDIATLIVALLFLALSFLGITGVSDMNKIHSFVIFFGLTFAAIMCVNYVGGVGVLMEKLPEGHLDLFVNGVPTAVAQFLGGALGFSISTTPISIADCARSEKIAKQSNFIIAAVSVFFALAPVTIGLCAAVSLTGIRPDAALWSMTSAVDPALCGVAVMAVFAAIFSTGPWLLISSAQLIVKELGFPILYKRKGIILSDEKQLKFTRVALVCVLVFAAAISGTNTSLLNSLMSAAQIKSIAVILLLFGIYWKRTSNRAGFAGLLVGGTLSTIWYIFGNPFGIQPLWIGLISSVLIIVIGSLIFCKQKVSPDYDAYEERIVVQSQHFAERHQEGGMTETITVER